MRKLGPTLLSLLILTATNASAEQASALSPEICFGSQQTYTPADMNIARERIADIQKPKTKSEEKRLSYWAYRHDSLHRRGIVDQILKNANSNCCGGAESGECRVSEVNMLEHKVLIDGEWCPVADDTKIVSVEGLENDEQVVVCAGGTRRSFPETYSVVCPGTYCIGGRHGT